MTTGASRLILFARAPRLGAVKTRLQPDLSADEALALHRGLVVDAVDLLRRETRPDRQVEVSFSEPLAADEPIRREISGIEATVQQGDDLGERLVRAFQSSFQRGERSVVVIGSDSPTLGDDYVESAFAALAQDEVVLGPAADGGYVLVGCSRLHVRPFQRIPWGSSRVLAETRRRLRREKVPTHLLRTEHDLDTVDDVRRTWKELEHLEQVGVTRAPRTLETLRTIVLARPEWLGETWRPPDP